MYTFVKPHKFPLIQSNGLRDCFGTIHFLEPANFQVKAAIIVVVSFMWRLQSVSAIVSHILVTGWLKNWELSELTAVRGNALFVLLFVCIVPSGWQFQIWTAVFLGIPYSLLVSWNQHFSFPLNFLSFSLNSWVWSDLSVF